MLSTFNNRRPPNLYTPVGLASRKQLRLERECILFDIMLAFYLHADKEN
jgi:hypothetical protein